MAAQQVVPVVCPSCGANFNAPFQNIINGQDPTIKLAFLQGRLTAAQCPQCGTVSSVDAPLLYYDLEKELALVYVPGGLNTSAVEQEQAVGQLTNSLMNQLEPEQKKFYLFNPKTFLSLETLFNAILEADGITPEMRAKQEARFKLLQEFLQLKDEAAIKEKVKAVDAELDREFFEIITSMMQTAHMEGNQALAQALVGLRTFLAQESSQGQQIVDDLDTEFGLVILKSRQDLLNRLQNAKNDEEFEMLIGSGYHMLDYEFFQKLTAEIDKAKKADNTQQVADLKTLRTKVLDIKAKQEEQNRVAFEKSAELLKKIFQSSNPQKVVAENLDQIDESFFSLLSGHIQHAQQQEQTEAVKAMEMVAQMAFQMLQERETAQ